MYECPLKTYLWKNEFLNDISKNARDKIRVQCTVNGHDLLPLFARWMTCRTWFSKMVAASRAAIRQAT